MKTRLALALSLAVSALALTITPARAAGKTVHVFKLSGPVGETRDPWDFLGLDQRIVFGELTRTIDESAANPQVGTLLFKLGDTDMGMAQVEELADAILRARKAGKRVVVHMDMGGGMPLVAATAADRVNVAPEGMIVLAGVQLQIAFYKDLLAKLGLEADLEQVGKYKSAAESMTRSDMSAPAREAFEALLDGIYGRLVERLAANRKQKPAVMRAVVDLGLMSAEEARKNGLVDTTKSWAELVRRLEDKSGKRPEVVFPVRQKLPDMSNFWGFLELLTKKPKGDEASSGKRIAVLTLEGPIVMGSASADPFSSDTAIASDEVVRQLKEIAKDPSHKAVVVRIDSPGGSALASDIIWQEIHALSKTVPVVVSMGNVAASGGYYIASAAKRIVAQPTTLTGSIGVFGGKLVMRGTLDKVGVNTVVLSRGQNAGLFSPLSRFSPSERAVLRKHIQQTYDTFVNRVAKGRSMSYDAVHRVAQGRVWTGAQAKEAGLVDELGGLDAAIAQARKLAKLGKGAEIVRYPQPKSLLEMLQDDPTELRLPALHLHALLGRIEQLLPGLGGELTRIASTLQTVLGREQTVAMMPFVLTIR